MGAMPPQRSLTKTQNAQHSGLTPGENINMAPTVGNQDTTQDKILVIGACVLDRLLHVSSYPEENGKILCEASFEYGENCILK